MRLNDLLVETYTAIFSNKVRTSLTILGIVIGIASVIAMIAIGQGAQKSIEGNIQSIGSNLIIVLPGVQRGFGSAVSGGRGGAQTLTPDDADGIKSISGVESIAPEIARRYQIQASNKNTNTQVLGTTPDYIKVRNVSIAAGSFILESHKNTASKVAVIGPATRDDLFGVDAYAIGRSIKINKIEFKVVGVLNSRGASGFGNQDDIIIIPITSARRFLASDDYLTSISVKAVSADDMLSVQRGITDLLFVRHKLKDREVLDFTVVNQSDIVAAASSVTSIFTMLLASIASISLLVGGIGIMNMMLTSVTERTREIGLRKAIGARRRDIAMQFLFESVFLTIVGGLIGIGLGYLIAVGVSSLMNIATEISPFSIILSFGVSTAIGVIFGLYPALRASKLSPIEALRYE